MGERHKRGVTRESAEEQAMRNQEVLRANRELSAYFRGRRTEREARAALKIIKVFVRDRERQDPRSRPALPGVDATKKKVTNREATDDGGVRHRRTLKRKPHDKLSKSVAVSAELPVNGQTAKSPESDEPTS
jgi:hypothetical protein